MFWATVEWHVKPGQEDAFVDAWATLVLTSRGLFPARRALLLRDRDNSSMFLSMGSWPDDSQIEAWREQPGMVEQFERLLALAERRNQRDFDQVVDVG
jgi:quinol monooxygenase YgiN